jgi:hypothetical protein
MKSTILSKVLPFIFIAGLSIISGCKKDDFKPEESFIKIYDDADGNKKFVPLAIQQTDDQGYILLSAFNGWNIFLMKTDMNGELLWQKELPSTYVNAVPGLLKHNGHYYFVCMDAVGLFTYVMQVDENSGTIDEVQHFNQLLYPTYAYSNGSAVYIQNYNRVNYQTEIHELNASLNGISKSGSVNVLTSVENELVHHNSYTGRRFPFFISSTPSNNQIVMTGFYNYSFSLIFLNPNLEFTGVYNGAGFNGGVNAILPHSDSKYSVARFSNENQYFNANATLNPATIDIAESIPATGYSEIDPKKPVVVKSISIDGTNYSCFIGSSKSNHLIVSIFDNAGVFIGQKNIGQNTPYTICDATPTTDGGMMLLTQVKIMGNYQRIATIKLTDEQIKEIIENE